MKYFAGVLLASLAAAAPAEDASIIARADAAASIIARADAAAALADDASIIARADHELLRRQQAGPQTSSELENGKCKGATFIWCRGTLEPGNMGWIIGNYLTPVLHKGLNNDIAVQGVKYSAGILTNIGPGMADSDGVKDATRLFKLARTKCPGMIITGGGYSQGAAIMHRAIEKLDEETKSSITAMLLYGDTQYPWDKDSIKGFPKDKVKVICKSDDGVCSGGITVTPGHLSYSGKAAEGANWIVEKVKAARSSGGGKGGKGGKGGESSEGGEASEGGESSPEPAAEEPAPKAKSPKGKGDAKGSPKGKSGKGKGAWVQDEFFDFE